MAIVSKVCEIQGALSFFLFSIVSEMIHLCFHPLSFPTNSFNKQIDLNLKQRKVREENAKFENSYFFKNQILYLRTLLNYLFDTYNYSLLLDHHGEGNGNPLQCSCLENPRDGGAWWAAICGVAQSLTQLKQLSSSRSIRSSKDNIYSREYLLS